MALRNRNQNIQPQQGAGQYQQPQQNTGTYKPQPQWQPPQQNQQQPQQGQSWQQPQQNQQQPQQGPGQQAYAPFAPRALTPAQLAAAFEGTKEADTKLLSSKFPKIMYPGVHLIEVQAVKIIPSTKIVGLFYIVEFKVIRTNVPERVIEGNTYSWSNNLSHPIFGKANMKQFLAAIQGYEAGSPEEQAIDDQDGLDSVGEDQPCTGMQCWVETSPNEKGTFIRHRFWPAT